MDDRDNDNDEAVWLERLAQAAKGWDITGQTAPDSSDETDGTASTDGDAADEHIAHFDTDEFLKGLDALYDAHEAKTKAEPYLKQAMADAENAGDDAGLLTVLNETMGFYRSHGRHDDNQWIIQRALELGLKMRIQGTEAWTTTLINAATGLRAAKRYDQAKDIYDQALESAGQTYKPGDRRIAALHNNISMLYSETGDLERAQTELQQALDILTASSTNPATDLDVASTHTNLALVLAQRATACSDDEDARAKLIDEAMEHATQTLTIYRTGHLEHSAHYASALAGYAQVCFVAGRFDEAVQAYRHALKVIEECYGKDTDYYRITAANLVEAEQAAEQTDGQERRTTTGSHDNSHSGIHSGIHDGSNGHSAAHSAADTPQIPATTAPTPSSATAISPKQTSPQSAHPTQSISGLELAKAYWQQVGKPMLNEKYPEYVGRIAVGLVGHGSECYGFDDEHSHDHDFGPRFCLWLTREDYDQIGKRLETDYEALPQEFMGFAPRESTARAQGAARRDGVFEIGDFFVSITGYRSAPAESKPHEWLLLDEATLATATNGRIFADPLGAFSKTRQGFKFMPDDVRLALISHRLGMIAQAGQYNLPRMLSRDDGAAAWLSIQEFVTNTSSLVFLINRPETAGYMPYYKWQFAALRRLSRRTATRLKDVCGKLETILRLSSAACYGGEGFGEGGKGAAPAASRIQTIIEDICTEITAELQAEGLTSSAETFLEWQRPYVEEHIVSQDPVLHSL